MNIAVIPARGGSKRIPRKNIKVFCGKPIIAWSIEAARASGCFDRTIVSTDDEGIAAVARKWGAETPFYRPVELSDDQTGTIPVIHHAIEELERIGDKVDNVCCIYATAPFVRPGDLVKGLDMLKKEDCAYVVPVADFPYPIQRAVRININQRIEMFHPENFHIRSQDLEVAYHDAGQFYWGTSIAWKKRVPLFSTQSVPIVLPRKRVQDIDTDADWLHAEWLFKALQEDL